MTVIKGVALPSGGQRVAFVADDPTGPASLDEPHPGDCMLLGLRPEVAADEQPASPRRLIVRIDVSCLPAEGSSIDPRNPPLTWHVWGVPEGSDPPTERATTAGAQWREVDVTDGTGGFNLPQGAIDVFLPDGLVERTIAGKSSYWLRCLVTRGVESPDGFQHSPRIAQMTVASVGATIPAENATRQEQSLGRSDGTRGQIFRRRGEPLVAAGEDDCLIVGEPGQVFRPQGPLLVGAGDGSSLPGDARIGSAPNGLPGSPGSAVDSASGETVGEVWERVTTFANSLPDSHHYALDEVTGEITFGPVVRQASGAFQSYGAVPAKGAELIFRYRSGGGVTGNVPAESLTHPRGAIPKVQSVINAASAAGGQDEESMDDLRARAGMQLHARDRVVTARDIDDISRTASPRIVATHCVPDVAGVRVYLVTAPLTPPDARPVPLSEFVPDDQLRKVVQAELDRRRLLGVNLLALKPGYRIVRVVALIDPAPSVSGDAVRRSVEDRLYQYLSPIAWTIGAALKLADVGETVERISGVARLRALDVHEVVDGVSHRLSEDLGLQRDELIVSGRHLVSTKPSGQS
jgi:hypothetical protein